MCSGRGPGSTQIGLPIVDAIWSFGFVGIYEKEIRAIGIALADLLNGRCVATRDRTVAADEHQHHDLTR